MEEFIENLEAFRAFLYNYTTNPSIEGAVVLEDLISKFEELGLNDAF